MRPDVFFCAEAARHRGERIFGTAPYVETWLLIEHPGPWSDKSFPDDRLEKRVRLHLRRLSQQLPVCRRLMIRQHYNVTTGLRCLVAESRQSRSQASYIRFESYSDLLGVDANSLTSGEPVKDHFFLVCTHGKHDKCCAKFGFPTYTALRQSQGLQAWECSHVGGDRFAASAIWMPHGIYFGNVIREDVPALLEDCNQNRIRLQHYRGRCCYSHVEQAAEYFIRSESGLLGIDDFVWQTTDEILARRWRCRFHCPRNNQTYSVELQSSDTLPVRLTCHSHTYSPVPQYELLTYKTE